MKLTERSYSAQSHRPSPQVGEERNTNTLIVATSWGDPEHAQFVINEIREQLVVSSNPDATRIGTFISDLSDIGNHMRSAVLHANHQLYKKHNSKEYLAAVEIALISAKNNVLTWVQLGTPHLLLKSKNGFQPLATHMDWTWQYQQNSPLLTKALGLEKHCYPQCGSCRIQGGEEILLMSRSAIPEEIFTLKNSNLSTCSEVLIEDEEQAPFWLGLVAV